MKKIIILPLFIIILVAVDWFRPAFCQENDSEKLLKKYHQVGNRRAEADAAYSSPEIYGETPAIERQEVEIPDVQATEILDAVTEKLEPFGYDLFRNASELSPPSEVAHLDDYILGPGDNIIIYLWGKVEKEYNLTVDRQGKVFIPKVGEIVVWGLALKDFESHVAQKLSGVYKDFRASVSLGKIRSIRVFLTGEVKKPGAYTVSSLTTLFNALYLAGGPNKRGSLRDIKLIRNNKIHATLDLYQFLLKGDSRSDVRLASGDAIFVPVTGSRVSISGQVKRPAIYELTGGEKISQLLQLAGGPTAEAYLDRVMLDRISPNDEREVIDLNLNPGNEGQDDIELADGDILTVFSMYDMRRNIVSIAGMVKHPGQFERTDSTTLQTLVHLGELLPTDVYFERANLFRRYPDRRVEIIPVNLQDVLNSRIDLPLQNLDSLHVYAIDEIKRKKYVSIAGQVKNPGKYPLSDKMTISDLVFLAGNLNMTDYAVNVHLKRANLFRRYADRRTEIIPIDLRNVLIGQAETELQDLDSLHIYSVDEVQREKYVYISGEVKNPGSYPLADNMNLSDLIFLAGNLNKRAYQLNVELARTDSLGQVRLQNIDITDPDRLMFQLQEDDHIFVRQTPDWLLHRIATIEGEVKFPGQYALLSKNETLYDIIGRAGGFTQDAFPEGTIFRRGSIGENLTRQNLPEIISSSQPLKEDSSGNIEKVELIRFNPESMDRIIIDMEEISSSGGKKGNITLQSNDYIYVPRIPSGISVMGAVAANGTIKFVRNKNTKYYVERAGNFTSQADKKRTRLIKADGRVFSGTGTLRKKIDIGDAIVVPTEIKKDHNWLNTISTAVSIVGGLATTVFIIDRL